MTFVALLFKRQQMASFHLLTIIIIVFVVFDFMPIPANATRSWSFEIESPRSTPKTILYFQPADLILDLDPECSPSKSLELQRNNEIIDADL